MRERHAEEAQLLADDGEDEVGVLRGQEREPLLRAHACSPSRTSRPEPIAICDWMTW